LDEICEYEWHPLFGEHNFISSISRALFLGSISKIPRAKAVVGGRMAGMAAEMGILAAEAKQTDGRHRHCRPQPQES
jgi:hypothetical protein